MVSSYSTNFSSTTENLLVEASGKMSEGALVPEGMHNVPHIIANGRFHPLVSYMVPVKNQVNTDIIVGGVEFGFLVRDELNIHGSLSDYFDSDSDSDCESDASDIEEISGDSFAQVENPSFETHAILPTEQLERPSSDKSMRSLSKDSEDDEMKSLFGGPDDDDMQSPLEESEDDDMKSLFGDFEDEE